MTDVSRPSGGDPRRGRLFRRLAPAALFSMTFAAVFAPDIQSDARRAEVYAREDAAASRFPPTAGARELGDEARNELARAFAADPTAGWRRHPAVRWRFTVPAGFEVGPCRSVFGDGRNLLFRHQAEVDGLDTCEAVRVEARLAQWSPWHEEWVDAVVID